MRSLHVRVLLRQGTSRGHCIALGAPYRLHTRILHPIAANPLFWGRGRLCSKGTDEKRWP
jgi:hypothetical protein